MPQRMNRMIGGIYYKIGQLAYIFQRTPFGSYGSQQPFVLVSRMRTSSLGKSAQKHLVRRFEKYDERDKVPFIQFRQFALKLRKKVAFSNINNESCLLDGRRPVLAIDQ